MRPAALVVLVIAVTSRPAHPAPQHGWPHTRGPPANAFAPNADPPTTWDAKTHLKWTADLPGKGSSSPIVWGDQVIVAAAVETEKQARPEDLPQPDARFKVNTNPP